MTTHTFDTPGPLAVRIENKSGGIELTTHPGTTTEVEISALEDAAFEQVERSRVEHKETDGRHRVEIEVPSGARGGGLVRRMLGNSVAVRVAVRLPEGATIEVATASASTRAVGRIGAALVQSASGPVTLDEVGGDVDISTASGAVRIGNVGGATKIRTASGDVWCGFIAGNKIATASGQVRVDAVGGRLVVTTASGDVRAGEITDGCSITTASGDQLIDRMVAGEASLESVSGDLTVRVALGTAVKVDAETVSGRLSSEIDLDADEPHPAGGARLDLRARTVSGAVRLQRAQP